MRKRTAWGIAAGGFIVAAVASYLGGAYVLATTNFTLACAMFVFSQR